MEGMMIAAAGSGGTWPFVVLALSVCVIVLLITVARLHAFLALILAAMFVGLLSGTLPGEPEKSLIFLNPGGTHQNIQVMPPVGNRLTQEELSILRRRVL